MAEVLARVHFIVVAFLSLTVAVTIHEFAHAIVADRMGDDTPRRHGRISLNPMVLWRAEPLGTIVVPLLSAAMGGLMGWATTPVNPANVRRSIPVRRASFWISAAGPLSNLLQALLFLGLWLLLAPRLDGSQGWHAFVVGRAGLLPVLVNVNVVLFFFNLFPISPLDGFSMLKNSAPPGWGPLVRFLEEYGMVILLLVIMFGAHLLGPLVDLWWSGVRWALR